MHNTNINNTEHKMELMEIVVVAGFGAVAALGLAVMAVGFLRS